MKDAVKQSPLFGINQGRGTAFDDQPVNSEKGLPFPRKIIIRRGCIIDKISFEYESHSTPHGGEGGSLYTLSLNEGEYIVKVAGTSSSFDSQMTIQDLVFTTSNGRNLGVGSPSRSNSNYFEYTVEKGYAICGLHGRAKPYVYNIGFHARQIEMDPSGFLPKGSSQGGGFPKVDLPGGFNK